MTLILERALSGYSDHCHHVGACPQSAASRPRRLVAFLTRTRGGVVESERVRGVEAEIGARGAIEELEITEQRNVGPHVLQKQRLTPAVVADDDVGSKSVVLQAESGLKNGLTVDDRVFDVLEIVVDAGRGRTERLVDYPLHPTDPIGVVVRHENHPVSRDRGQMGRDMLVLPGKVLVNEEVVHRGDVSAA